MSRSVIEDPFLDPNASLVNQLIGFVIFFVLFIFTIPYLLLKNGMVEIFEGYIPNVDMIATILGFNTKDFPEMTKYFKYLYNPETHTKYGYISQNVINYLALLGVTFFVSYYTFKTKSISKGWGRAFIMLPVTYLIPGNFISYYMEKLYDYLEKHKVENRYMKNGLVYGFGFLVVLFFINMERIIIDTFGDDIGKILQRFFKLS